MPGDDVALPYQVEFERLELKYLVDEASARAIARALDAYCEPDPHNGLSGRGYSVSSLYFDSPDLAFFRAKARSDHDRLKLRARTYRPGGPVSLEIKRKRGDVVWKERAAVPAGAWIEAAQGFAPATLLGSRQTRALERFASLLAHYGAEPKIVVEYQREGYAARTGEYARITFDRHVEAHASEEWNVHDARAQRMPLVLGETERLGAAVLMEIKVEQFMPAWIGDLIRAFQLSRVGFSKYNTAMCAHLDSIWVRDPFLRTLRHA